MQLKLTDRDGHGSCLTPLLGVFVAAVLGCAPSGAQSFSPYSMFQSMSLAQMATLEMKLTYAGNQTVGTRSLVMTATGHPADISLFVPFRRSVISYVNDDGPPLTFSASTQQLKALIDSVGTLPAVTDGDVDPDGYISFGLLNTAGGDTAAFEAVVNDTTGPLLFGKMLAALKGNIAGTRLLSEFGCGASALPTDAPASLEGQVSITFGGLRQDRRTKSQFLGSVRITNISKSIIPGPISLVVVRQGNAELLEESGVTCNIYPQGFPYVDLHTIGGLAPGATAEQRLRFHNPSLEKFDVTFRAFSGPGTR
jgi:hypothetical protein